MPAENLKSGFITNRDSTPRILTNPAIVGGHLESAIGMVETTTSSDPGSTYRMFQLPSNCIVHELRLYSDDMGTTGLIDIGIYRSTEDGGAVVDADFFASAVDVKTAAVNGTDVTHESGVFNIDDSEKPLWSALGLSSDPGLLYDVVCTTTEAFSAGGTLVLKAKYVF